MTICQNNTVVYTDKITKLYKGAPVIQDVSITLNRREIVSVLGPSGVGKTTLFHIISGLLKPDSGRVFYERADVTGKFGVFGYMQQKDLLLQHKKIIDNVCLPFVIKGMNRPEARQKAAEHFEAFGLSGCEGLYPSQLSGGMRQRAALLRTYLQSKPVYLFDEPFSALDYLTKTAMHGWFLSFLKNSGFQALFITHDIDEALTLSDRIYILKGAPGTISSCVEIQKNNESADEFRLSAAFLAYKREILELLA